MKTFLPLIVPGFIRNERFDDRFFYFHQLTEIHRQFWRQDKPSRNSAGTRVYEANKGETLPNSEPDSVEWAD
jgi:hypothetical protein